MSVSQKKEELILRIQELQASILGTPFCMRDAELMIIDLQGQTHNVVEETKALKDESATLLVYLQQVEQSAAQYSKSKPP